jgi:nucleoid-associated protein YgaU
MPNPPVPPAVPAAKTTRFAPEADSPELPRQKRKYTRRAKPIVEPPVKPLAEATEAIEAIEAPPPAKPALTPEVVRDSTKKPPMINVVLAGRYKGAYANDNTIIFYPGVITQVPEDDWIKAQLTAKYLKKV